jgi:hypothetical protein
MDTLRYNFLEIGTCDFDLYPYSDGERGIRVEPVPYYFEKLPKLPNVINVRAAITALEDFWIDVAYVNPEYLHLYPDWMRGCNSILRHPEWKSVDPSHLLSRNARNLSILDLVDIFDITALGYLKIDTEGCDYEILDELFLGDLKPNIINVEYKYFQKSMNVKDYYLVDKGPSSLVMKHKVGESTRIVNG